MNRNLVFACGTALLGASTVIWASAAGAAEAVDSFEQAFRQADFHVDYRVRYESVDQAGFIETADAVTSRLRAGLITAPLRKTRLQAEAVWVDGLVSDYNSTTNGNTQYPVVADPAGFVALNRFAIINQSLEHATLTFGRQRVVLDDSRFVGNVGWRQNEQTFDAVRAQLAGPAIKADLTYADQVNRIFGPDSPAGRWHGDVVLANLEHVFPVGMLTLFDYYMDFDEAASASSNSVGLRLTGSKAIGKIGATYSLSVARQGDAGANPADYRASYYLLEGGLNFRKIGVALGHELLGSDGTNAFSTPLATLHAFQGWSDKFLATPAAGMADSYVKLAYPMGQRGRFKNISALAFFHDFAADVGSAHYGEELDLQLVARTDRVALTLKYADYRADTLLTDTSKVWVSMDYSF